MYLQLLKEINQAHIVEAYQQASEEDKQGFDAQIAKIQSAYPGGLRSYHQNALKLLKESALGLNPYADYIIGKPQGQNFSYDDLEKWEKYETLGFKELASTVFVLVAGGLGERLGYPGIKISIPMQLLTKKCFIQYYCEYIQAYQEKFCAGKAIPLVIMTSEDTNAKTIALLEENKYFGLKKEQVHILNQEKVPAMIDNQAHFNLLPGKLQLETKPHGHGDVHTLLHMSGLASRLQKEGHKWLVIFQDTNPFALKSFPLMLGISADRDFDMNSLAMNRKPGEAVGAITTLVHKQTKKVLTVNVEYNQLQNLFKESGGEPVDEKGFSKYPGNSNCFVLKMSTYVEVLERTQGLISEFINPKYSDATKTKFKSSTRLECMMQDYPKLLQNCDKVGFTDVPRNYSFTTVKNDLASANAKIKQGLAGESSGSCEADFYQTNRHLMRLAGAEIEEVKSEEVGGAELPLFPMVSFSPRFATCFTELRPKIKKLRIVGKSSLVIENDCVLEDVELDGHLTIKEGGSIKVQHKNQDYKQFIDLEGNEEPFLKIRGYKLKAE